MRLPRYRTDVKIRVDRLYKDLDPYKRNLAVTVSPVLSRRIAAAELSVIVFVGHAPVVADTKSRSLESLLKSENHLWTRWRCLWTQDPILKVLNQLEDDLEDIICLLSVRSQCPDMCVTLNSAVECPGSSWSRTSAYQRYLTTTITTNESSKSSDFHRWPAGFSFSRC